MLNLMDEYGFQPIVVFDDAGRMIAAVLGPASQPTGRQIVRWLHRLIAAIRGNWPRVQIILRADNHYCTPEVLRFCRTRRLDYKVGGAAHRNVAQPYPQAGGERYDTGNRPCGRDEASPIQGIPGWARVRLWKSELQTFADQTGLSITVAHLPPGTSKWNRIEHHLFAFITQNWRGKPLLTHQVIVQLIASTTTQTGLTVQCRLDENTYEKGTKVSDALIASLNITPADFHGEWNYTIAPRTSPNWP